MKLGMIGLGKMGGNMALRLMRGGHELSVFDVNSENARAVAIEGATSFSSLEELVKSLPTPRALWMMLPAGEITESTLGKLKELLASGDVVIDGGNSYFKDDVRRAGILAEKGIQYMDVGTSGGVWGLERGYCLMIGGEGRSFDHLEPIFKTLAPGVGAISKTPGRKSTTAEEGYIHCGPVGSGHFVKMVHNGIEYGLMAAFGEGFDILKGSANEAIQEGYRYRLNLPEITEVWRRGSVISSWLLDLLAIALSDDAQLSKYIGSVQDSGEGRWTVQAAVEEAVSANVISAALFARFRSREDHTFGEKVLSAMRHAFGGHLEAPEIGKGSHGHKKVG
jgi:6-phosphogluconate dehydrogenase